MPHYHVTVTARRLTDVQTVVAIFAKNAKSAEALVKLQIAEDQIPDDQFEEVDRPQLSDMQVELVEKIATP